MQFQALPQKPKLPRRAQGCTAGKATYTTMGIVLRIVRLAVVCFAMMAGANAASAVDPSDQKTVTIHDLVEVRDFSGLQVCEKSNLIAVRVDRSNISENRIEHDWHVIEWPSGNVRLTADAGDSLNTLGFRERSYPQWSPDCHWLYYRALHNGEVQIWRLSGTTGAPEKVTSDSADILNFVLIQHGKALVYETSASRAAILAAEDFEYQYGVLIDENVWPKAQLTETFPVYSRWASFRSWDPGDAGHLLSREPPIYRTIITQDRKVRTATRSETSELMNPDSDWAPQPNIGILTSRRGDHAAIVLTKKETVYGNPLISMVATVRRDKLSEIHKCDDDRCTAERLALLHWSSDGSSVYFIAEQKRGAAGIYEWRPSNGKVRAILETDGLLGALASGGRRYKSSSCPVVEEFAFCTAADPENPPRLMAISLPSGSARTVFDPNAELRKRFSLKAERVFWKDGLERDAVGVLVYPREFEIGTRYPLVITTYKCPGFLMGGIADGGPEYVLAENGFLVLCIDRNPDVYDTLRPEYSRAEARYISALAEYESAIDMLVKSGLADRQRVGVTGLSASSQSVSYALTHSDIFHVAALRAIGVWEPGKSMFYRRGMALAEAVKEHNGIGENGREAKDVYESLSVTLRAERITAPILAQASDSEYLGSLPAFAALHNLGKPIEMIVFPDEAHQLHQPMHRYVNFTRNLDWFRFWLQGYEGPDPEKQEQYGRWRKMREQQCERLKGEDTPTYCLQ